MGSARRMKGSWVNGALIVAALAGLSVLVAASLFGGVAWALARDVGLNCIFWCFFGSVGVGVAFAALGSDMYFEGIRRQMEENEAADAARRIYEQTNPGYGFGSDGPAPGNDASPVY